MGQIAKKRDPELWARAKRRAVARMGGKHSARAMQLAVRYYKKAGGRYAPARRSARALRNNSLRRWTQEDWGYTGKPRKSRYLPAAVRERLTPAEKAATSRAKNRGTRQGKQWVPQPASIRAKIRALRVGRGDTAQASIRALRVGRGDSACSCGCRARRKFKKLRCSCR